MTIAPTPAPGTGLVYGAAARPVIGPELAVVSSLIVFSGAAQFTMVALVAAGATPAAVLAGVATLALRHCHWGRCCCRSSRRTVGVARWCHGS